MVVNPVKQMEARTATRKDLDKVGILYSLRPMDKNDQIVGSGVPRHGVQLFRASTLIVEDA
jgi:hypothetical protein